MEDRLKEQELVPGKRYKGYGWVNSYMEMFFRPQAEGSHAGQIKKVAETDRCKLSLSKKYVLLNIRIPRGTGRTYYFRQIMSIVDEMLEFINKYNLDK